MTVSRARLFIENFLVYGMAGVLGKAIPFIMLPLITRLITDPSVFGKLELYRLMVSFGTPIAVIGMYDSMFRFYFDDSSLEYRKAICSSALLIVLCTGIILFIMGFAGASLLTGFVFGEIESKNLVYVALLVILISAAKNIVAAPTRMQNKRRVYMVMHILVPVTSYAVSIPIIILGFPLTGLVAGSALSILLSLALFWYLNGKWFALKLVQLSKVKELLKFGVPLAPTFFVYWIFKACDRLMIVHMMGQDAVGVYGIGARVAGISALIYMAFSGGWQYFAFSTMKDSDHVLLISRTFQVLALLSFTATLFFIPAIQLVFPFLVGHAYRESSVITPYLFLSPLLLMLSQILGTQLQVIKRPGLSTTIRSACAFLNVGLNFWLIPIMGIEGAAIATVSSYAVMTFLMVILTFKFDLFVLDRRFLAAMLSFALLFALYKNLMWNNLLMAVVLASLWTLAVLWSYHRVVFATLRRIQKKVREHNAWGE